VIFDFLACLDGHFPMLESVKYQREAGLFNTSRMPGLTTGMHGSRIRFSVDLLFLKLFDRERAV
jgi:hypothetical protein